MEKIDTLLELLITTARLLQLARMERRYWGIKAHERRIAEIKAELIKLYQEQQAVNQNQKAAKGADHGPTA